MDMDNRFGSMTQWAWQSLLIDVTIIKGKKEKKSKAIEK